MHMEGNVFTEEKTDVGTLRDKGHGWERLHRKKLEVGLHERVAETESVIRLDEKISGRNFGYLVLDIDTQMVKPINLLDYKRPVTCSQPSLRPWGHPDHSFITRSNGDRRINNGESIIMKVRWIQWSKNIIGST